MNPILPFYLWIAGKTRLFNLDVATSLREKLWIQTSCTTRLKKKKKKKKKLTLCPILFSGLVNIYNHFLVYISWKVHLMKAMEWLKLSVGIENWLSHILLVLEGLTKYIHQKGTGF